MRSGRWKGCGTWKDIWRLELKVRIRAARMGREVARDRGHNRGESPLRPSVPGNQLPHRARAALCALSLRCALVFFFARAIPPGFPALTAYFSTYCSRPNATPCLPAPETMFLAAGKNSPDPIRAQLPGFRHADYHFPASRVPLQARLVFEIRSLQAGVVLVKSSTSLDTAQRGILTPSSDGSSSRPVYRTFRLAPC